MVIFHSFLYVYQAGYIRKHDEEFAMAELHGIDNPHEVTLEPIILWRCHGMYNQQYRKALSKNEKNMYAQVMAMLQIMI